MLTKMKVQRVPLKHMKPVTHTKKYDIQGDWNPWLQCLKTLNIQSSLLIISITCMALQLLLGLGLPHKTPPFTDCIQHDNKNLYILKHSTVQKIWPSTVTNIFTFQVTKYNCIDSQNLAIRWVLANTNWCMNYSLPNIRIFILKSNWHRWWLLSGVWHPGISMLNWSTVNVSQCLKHPTDLEVLHGWYSRQSNDHNSRNHTDFCTCHVPKVATIWSHPCIEHTTQTAREIFCTVTLNRLNIPLCTTNITHKQIIPCRFYTYA
jgi:hypothetical protein